MSETKEVTPEFVQYIKERDAALEEKNKAESELRQTQCKLYDALQMIEKLEKKVSEASDTKNKSGGGQAKAAGAAKKPPATNTKKKSTGQQSNGHSLKAGASTTSSSGVSSGRNSLISSARTTVGLYHPPVASIEPVTDSRDYYAKLSDKFPTLSMFTVLDAEKKFMKADADSSGYIDIDELDKVLSDTVGMFTQKQLEEIMKEIDTDDSQTLDFLEVLTVLYKLVSKRKTNLPNSVQQNYTKTCNVQ